VESDTARSRPPIFLLRLQAQPGSDATRNLKQFLKLALRRYQLRCIDAREESQS
jgi:hypothetical protein